MSKLLRVSTILDRLCPLERGVISDEELSIKARFGTATHKLIHRVARAWDPQNRAKAERWLGRLKPSPLAENARAFFRFLSDTEPSLVRSEVQLVDRILGFCGRPDLLLAPAWLIDIKTGEPQLRHEVQLAAYAHLFFGDRGMSGVAMRPRCSILRIRNGTYRVFDVSHDRIASHWKAFRAQLEIEQWRRVGF